MHVLFNLPELHLYQDTLVMLNHLASQVSSLEILTTPLSEKSKRFLQNYPLHSHLSLSPLTRQKYANQASKRVHYRIQNQTLDVIHDLFGHLSDVCQVYSHRPRSFVMLTTQRTTNWGWFERVKPLHFGLNFKYAGQRLLSLWRDRRILSAVDHIVVLGPGHEQDLLKAHHLNPQKITYLPSETDPTLFYPPSPKDENDRVPQRLLYTGALSRNKGVDLIFDLFTHLAPLYPKLHLHLIGRFMPFEKEWFESTLNHHPYRSRITLFSALDRPRLRSHYQHAQIYLFPSLFEGSPRSLREAVASGCSCIASEIAGCRGIDPQGEFLRFAPPSDLQAWIDQTHQALNESSHEFHQRQHRGWKRIQHAHSPQAVADAYFRLYRILLEKQTSKS